MHIRATQKAVCWADLGVRCIFLQPWHDLGRNISHVLVEDAVFLTLLASGAMAAVISSCGVILGYARAWSLPPACCASEKLPCRAD